MRAIEGRPDGAGLRFGIVVSRFNHAVTERLLAGALEALVSHGVSEDGIEVVRVPGAFEIPQAVRWLVERGGLDGIVCLGAVIRGETPHFEYIAAAVVAELERLAVTHGVPLGLGVLTTNTVDQALERAGAGLGNKGSEAARAALELAALRRALR